MKEDSHKRVGYLHENFQLFHIKDQLQRDFDLHYHDFNKILIFLSGNVTYLIEGKVYYLKPWDILLVNQFDLHKPIINSSVPYERVVIYVKNDYITSLNDDICDISTCFHKTQNRRFNLIRLEVALQEKLKENVIDLETSLKSDAFGSSLLSNALFIQFMVHLNRIVLGHNYIEDTKSLKYDSQIEKMLQYINENLREDLSIETLANLSYLSKYHLMRKFKQETGYTLHNYIVQKRLLLAQNLILQGVPITKAAKESGFSDYTTFSRAYKKQFYTSPSQNNLKK